MWCPTTDPVTAVSITDYNEICYCRPASVYLDSRVRTLRPKRNHSFTLDVLNITNSLTLKVLACYRNPTLRSLLKLLYIMVKILFNKKSRTNNCLILGSCVALGKVNLVTISFYIHFSGIVGYKLVHCCTHNAVKQIILVMVCFS